MTPFDIAWKFTSRWEGGYSNHPDDPGGATNYGITQATYNHYLVSRGQSPQSVKDLTPEGAKTIAKESYWDAMGLDSVAEKNPNLAIALFDWGFHSGTQNVLNRTKGMEAAADVMDARVEFLTGLKNFNSFGKGWIRRVEDLRKVLGTSAVQGEVEIIQVFDGDRLIATFRPVAVSFGSTEAGTSKIMVRFS